MLGQVFVMISIVDIVWYCSSEAIKVSTSSCIFRILKITVWILAVLVMGINFFLVALFVVSHLVKYLRK